MADTGFKPEESGKDFLLMPSIFFVQTGPVMYSSPLLLVVFYFFCGGMEEFGLDCFTLKKKKPLHRHGLCVLYIFLFLKVSVLCLQAELGLAWEDPDSSAV